MSQPADFRCPTAYDATRPMVLGFVRASLFGSHKELAEATEQLATAAQVEGYTLGAVFTEQPDTAPAAFSALVDAVRYYEARGIVVPSPEHLAVLGTPPVLSDYLQRITGVPLIVVRKPAAGRPAPTRGAKPTPPAPSVPPWPIRPP